MKRDVAEYERMARVLLHDIFDPVLLQAGPEHLYVNYALATADFDYLAEKARAGDPHARSVVDLFVFDWENNRKDDLPLPEPLASYIQDERLGRLGPTRRGQRSRYLYLDYQIAVAALVLRRQMPELKDTRERYFHGSKDHPSRSSIIFYRLNELDVHTTERHVQAAVRAPLCQELAYLIPGIL